jgi:hypothetical protein
VNPSVKEFHFGFGNWVDFTREGLWNIISKIDLVVIISF